MRFQDLRRPASPLQAQVDEAILQRICARALGRGAALVDHEYLQSGRFNTTYRLHFARHRPLILRLAPPPEARLFRHEVDLMQRECAIHPHLALAGPVIAKLVAADFSRALVPRPWVLLDCLEGELWSELADRLSPDDSASVWQQFGQHVRRIHAMPGLYYGSPLATEGQRYSDWLRHLVDLHGLDLRDLGPCGGWFRRLPGLAEPGPVVDRSGGHTTPGARRSVAAQCAAGAAPWSMVNQRHPRQRARILGRTGRRVDILLHGDSRGVLARLWRQPIDGQARHRRAFPPLLLRGPWRLAVDPRRRTPRLRSRLCPCRFRCQRDAHGRVARPNTPTMQPESLPITISGAIDAGYRSTDSPYVGAESAGNASLVVALHGGRCGDVRRCG